MRRTGAPLPDSLVEGLIFPAFSLLAECIGCLARVHMSDHAITFGPFRLIPSQRLLLEGNTPLQVGNRALTILQILVERAGEVVDKRELARQVWPDTFVEETNIRVHVAALRRALGDGQNGARYIVNIPGRGYSFTAAVSILSEPTKSDRSIVRKPSAALHLPGSITRLVGRSEAVTKLRAELTRERMVTVVGPAGIGKTSLALAAAQSWSSDSDYAAYFVDLAAVSDPGSVPAAVASAISAPTIYEDILGAMLRELQDRRLLIILDNCEHVIDAAARLCVVLLTGTLHVRLLATSREPLRIAGEWTHRVASLGLPPVAQKLTASEAMTFPSVQLFVERAMANVDTYAFRDQDAAAVADICRRLDGIPLAVEFAAARVDLFDVRTIAQRLDDRFTLLTRGQRNALPRQQTLRAALDWSYDLLSPDEQVGLRRLSVFSAYFGVDDAIGVVSDDKLPRQAVLDTLSDLVAKSMVAADVGGHAVTYRLLETIQVYAHEKLSEAGELDALRRRHAQRFLNLCRAPVSIDDDQGMWRQAMVDVRAALDWALVRGGDIALGVDLASAATPVSLRLSLLREHRKYLELALAHIFATADPNSGTETALRAEMGLRSAAALALYFTEGPQPAVDGHLQKARRIAQDVRDQGQELRVLWMLYGIAGNTGNYRQELAYSEMFATVADDSTDPMGRLRSRRVMSRALSDLGQHDLAQQQVELALQPARERLYQAHLNAYEIDHWIASRAAYARILWLRGYPDDAKKEAEACISQALRLGHEQSTCWALAFNVCPIAIWRGELAEASHFANLLLEHSQNVFQHWHEWGLLYEKFLKEAALGPDERDEAWLADLEPTLPAQADLLATFDIRLAGRSALARAQADEDIWCAAEILRAWTDRHITGDTTGRSGSEAPLAHSLEIARRQGAKAWELRAATSLASLLRGSARISQARDTLQSVLSHFSQGRRTKDVQAAADLLSQL
jgi:predicted ATPase/DNA-binding winged helix-turn-helix (wHTH) protein